MLYYTDLPIIVNHASGLVVESFNMSHQSPNESVQALGFRGRNSYVVNNSLRTSLSFSYYPQVSAEPFYNIVNAYKTDYAAIPFNVQLGDISGCFHLESLNYNFCLI